MNALKALNKEQWTLVTAAAVCGLMVLFSFMEGVSAARLAPPEGNPRGWEKPETGSAALPSPRVEAYLAGRNPWKGQSVSKLAMPYLRPPQPRPQGIPAPLLRPSPATGVLNGLDVKLKYPELGETPAVPAEAVPAAAEIQALAALEEPVVEPRKDRRHERRREFYSVKLKSGITYEAKRAIVLRDKGVLTLLEVQGGAAKMDVKLTDVVGSEPNDTWEEWYRKQTQRIQPGEKEAEERTALAKKLHEELGMIPEAKDELAKALKADPIHLPAVRVRVAIAWEESDFESAIRVCQEALEHDGAPGGDLYAEMGRCLAATGFPEGALAHYEHALEQAPLNSAAKLGVARMQLALGRPEEAASAMHDFFGKQVRLNMASDAEVAEAHYLRARAELAGGELGKAAQDLDRSLAKATLSGALNAKAVVAALQGRTAEAAQGFAGAIRAGQYETGAWLNLGTLLLLAGRWADAEAVFAAAEQRDPVSADAVAGRAVAQLRAGNAEGAKLLDRALEMDPGHAYALVVRGHLRLRAGQFDAALEDCKAALRSDFTFLPATAAAAAANLAAAEAKGPGGDAREMERLRVTAETLLGMVRDHNPGDPGALSALGCAYAALHRADEARLALREAVGLFQGKPDPLVLYALGYVEAYHGAGETVQDRLQGSLEFFTAAREAGQAWPDAYSKEIVAEAARAGAAIREWSVTTVRLDEGFERAPSKSVGNGWVERDGAHGLEAQVAELPGKGRRLVFMGTQTIKDWGLSSVSREIPGEGFYSLEATLSAERTEKVEYGLAIYTLKQGQTHVGLAVGIDPQRQVKYKGNAVDPRDLDGKDMALGWTAVKISLPDGSEPRFRITRTEERRKVSFVLWIYDPGVGDWVEMRKGLPIPGGDPKAGSVWKIQFWVRGAKGAQVAVAVDNVRVLERSE